MGNVAKIKGSASKANQLLESTADHSLQRKAAIAWGKCTDHAGSVQVVPMTNFDMGKTIFGTLEGKLPRMVITAKIANDVFWSDKAANRIETDYRSSLEKSPVPEVDTRLIDFMLEECDFSMEHADGSFLEHLLFCFEYSAKYFPDYSPNVMLLHSILGTGTNCFAMEASKLPKLKKLLTEFEAEQVDAFPSIFRLIYDLKLLKTLGNNISRLNDLESISFHRVIDNERISLSGENLWIALNYQLMHFVDFLPPANWVSHKADPLLQFFKDLSDFLDRAGKRMAIVDFPMPEKGEASVIGETRTPGGKFSAIIPPFLKKKLAAKSIRKFSEKIGHSLSFHIEWKR